MSKMPITEFCDNNNFLSMRPLRKKHRLERSCDIPFLMNGDKDDMGNINAGKHISNDIVNMELAVDGTCESRLALPNKLEEIDEFSNSMVELDNKDIYYGAGSVPVPIERRQSRKITSVLGIEIEFDETKLSSLSSRYEHKTVVMYNLIHGRNSKKDGNTTTDSEVEGGGPMEEEAGERHHETTKSDEIVHHVSPETTQSIPSPNYRQGAEIRNVNRPYYKPPRGYTYRTNINSILQAAEIQADEDKITEDFFMFEI